MYPFDQLPLRRRTLGSLLGGALLGLGQSTATATVSTAWPVRPVRLLVGFPAGSSPDLTARALAEPLGKALGQPVVVENRPGAGGNLAAGLLARATDDHTLGVLINGNLTIARLLNPSLGFDPLTDLAPVSLIGTAPLLLAAGTAIGGNDSAAGFLRVAREAGDRWSYGSPGVGTVAHIGMEWLKGLTAMAPVHVPYPGNPQVINAMLAGQIQLALLPPGLAGPQVRAGKLRAIGLTSAGRSVLAPDWPSLTEAGVRGYQLEIWNAIAAPATMPEPLRNRLASLVSELVRTPEMRQRLFLQGWQVAGTSPEGLANRIRSDTAALGRVIAERQIRAE